MDTRAGVWSSVERPSASPTRRGFLKRLGLAAAAAVAAGPGGAAGAGRSPSEAGGGGRRKPNILFILADDLGWMDTTVYGSRYYETPHIARLAARGMRFTDAYAANPLCSPTRASLMTGKWPARLGITTPAGHLPPEPAKPLMPERAAPNRRMICPRSRRVLPREEYTIAEALRDAGYRTGFVGKWHLGVPEPYWPEAQGFEVAFHGAPDPGPPSYFSPYRFRAGTVANGPKGEYITDRATDEAVRYLERHRDEPFFLCLWHWAVHAPFQAKEDLVAEARSRTDPRGKQDCPVMAGMIRSLDQSVGRVLDALDRLGLAEDTIILLFSDNGGNMYNEVVGTTPTNNAPLRNGKGSIYEGGVREPMVVVWPGAVRPGSQCTEVVSSVDFYPTLLEMAGVSPKPGQVLDGVSLVPILKGEGGLDRDAVFCHFPHYIPATGNLPSTSVRAGRWKLICFYGEGPDRTDAYELYDLQEDIGETTNLAEGHPDVVRRLAARIDAFLRETDAIVPEKNPAYAEPTAGWVPSKDCRLSVAEGRLVVESTGGDPCLWTNDVPPADGLLVAEVRMKSTARGGGMVFWGTRRQANFHRSRRVPFEPQHDGQWHVYEVSLPVEGTLRRLRIDPATAAGRIDIDRIRLRRPGGEVLKTWDFGDASAER